jgi:hypothetical protein
VLLFAQKQLKSGTFVVGSNWSSQGDGKSAGPGKDGLKLHLNFLVLFFGTPRLRLTLCNVGRVQLAVVKLWVESKLAGRSLTLQFIYARQLTQDPERCISGMLLVAS